MISEHERDARADVAAEARRWLRTPYAHGQRVRGAGVDCAQLLIGVFAEAGLLRAFDPPPYPPDWFLHTNEDRLLDILRDLCSPVAGAPQAGDVVTFRFGRAVCHAGIVVSPTLMVHAYRGAAVQLEEFTGGAAFAERYAGSWTLRDWGGRGGAR